MVIRRIVIGGGLCGSLVACSTILGIGDLPASDDAANSDASSDGTTSADGAASDGELPGDGGPDPNAPRLIAPLSTSRVTNNKPTLRWTNPAGITNVMIDLCSDRACTSPASAAVTGTSYHVPTAYSPGVVFWRVRNGTATSATWEFNVGKPTTTTDGGAPIDSSWGTSLDVNGDGYADIAVGSDQSGLVSLYYGKAGGLTAQADGGTPPSFSFSFTVSNALYSIASGGDLNGDGYADLVVGAGGNTSQAYVYYGSPSGVKATPSITLTAPAGDPGGFGDVVASAGDVNGDGYGDLLVSTGDSVINTGFVHLYLGSSTGIAATPATTLTDGSGVSFGASFAAGDVNGDGYSDIAIGEPGSVSANEGAALFFLGSPSGLNKADGGAAAPFTGLTDGANPHGRFGSTMTSADYNGDGYIDFVINSSGAFQSTSVYYGAPLALEAGTLGAPVLIAGAGNTLVSAGDINGDGYSDLIIANNPIKIAYGAVGGLANSVNAIPGDAGSFGTSVTSAGDLAKDGRGNLLVGAPMAAGQAGQAFIFVQSTFSGLDTDPLPILNPTTTAANQFGGHVGGSTN